MCECVYVCVFNDIVVIKLFYFVREMAHLYVWLSERISRYNEVFRSTQFRELKPPTHDFQLLQNLRVFNRDLFRDF